MIKIIEVKDPQHIRHVRHLFKQYAASLNIDISFQNFEAELANLPAGYTPPDGQLLLAFYSERIAGCVALRRLDDEACEMKRFYVKPDFRGLKVGYMLARAIIEEAKSLGYERMRLDTLPSMGRARGLYQSLGFKEIDPYSYNPVEGTTFMELELNSDK